MIKSYSLSLKDNTKTSLHLSQVRLRDNIYYYYVPEILVKFRFLYGFNDWVFTDLFKSNGRKGIR